MPTDTRRRIFVCTCKPEIALHRNRYGDYQGGARDTNAEACARCRPAKLPYVSEIATSRCRSSLISFCHVWLGATSQRGVAAKPRSYDAQKLLWWPYWYYPFLYPSRDRYKIADRPTQSGHFSSCSSLYFVRIGLPTEEWPG